MAPPVNDDFADRLPLSGASGSTTVDMTDATLEGSEPVQAGAFGGSAWWEWTAPVDLSAGDVVAFDTLASTGPVDTCVAIYEGTSLGGLTLLGWNRFADLSDNTSRATAHVVAGQTYQVQLQDPNSVGGDHVLTWAMGAAPGNDLFADRFNMGPAGTVTADLTYATKTTAEDSVQGGDEDSVTGTAWWRYQVPSSPPANITVTLDGTGRLGLCAYFDANDDDTPVGSGAVNTRNSFDLDTTSMTITLGAPWADAVLVFEARYELGFGTATLTWDQDGVGATEEDDPTPPDEEPDPDAVEDAIWQDIEDGTDVPPDTVVTPDLDGIGVLWRVSETYPAPTLDDDTGRPVDWAPTTVEEPWGTVAIAIDGVDVTKVRDVKTVIETLTWQEPFGEGPGQLTIPGASRWDRGTTGFEWLRAEANVDITHHDPDGVFVKNLYSGVVRSLGYGRGGWRLELMGAFAGPAGLMPHRPKLVERERDWGLAMTYAIRRAGRGASRRKSITEVEFGIATRDRGSRADTVLEYVSRGLGMCQTVDGDQWTLARVLDDDGHPIRRKYGWRLKDRDTVNITITPGGRDVTDDLQEDVADLVRLQMAEGVAPDGGRWRGTKLPNVGKETVPTYPGTPLDVGSTGDDVQVWQMEAHSDGHRTGDLDALTGGDFTETDADAAREIQEAAGLPVTGVVDEDTWDATWSNGDPDLNLGGARFDPIAADPRVQPFLLSSNGSVLAVNPDWDRTILPVGRMVSYGPDTPKRLAIRSAKADLVRGKDLVLRGTLTIDKVDPEEMSRLDITEGMNVQLAHAYGEPVLHIAGVRWARSGPSYSVTMDVDEAARDLLSLAAIRQRNRAAKQDPVRAAIAQLRSSGRVRDTPGTWDSEGGFGVLPPRDCTGGEWNVFVIAAGQYGNLSRLLLRTAPDTRFAVALFGAAPGKAWLDSHVPDPFVDPGDDHKPWDEPAIQDGLSDRLFIENWGEFKQRAGYSPGYETHPDTGRPTGHAVTGNLDAYSGTNYALAEEPKLFVAIWPEDDTTARGEVRLLPNE